MSTMKPELHRIITLLGINIAMKDLKPVGQNSVRHVLKIFQEKVCIEKVRNTRWCDILEMTDINTANSAFEDRLCAILDQIAPMKVIQTRSHYNCWISDNTKKEMALRNEARERAKMTDDEIDWINFRRKRNLCTNLQRQDKIKFHNELYGRIEEEKDSARLFGTTKQILGWSQSGLPNGFF